jgi:hypothetical protein
MDAENETKINYTKAAVCLANLLIEKLLYLLFSIQNNFFRNNKIINIE